MKGKRIVPVLMLMALAMLPLGVEVAGCGGGTTTTTVASTTTSAATGTTSGPGGSAPVKIEVDLSGDQAVPPVQTSASGTFILTLEAGPTGSFNISYELDVTDLVDAAAAHIHLGAAGTNGDVIVPLFNGPTKSGSFTGTLASGVITEADLTGPMQGKTFQELASSVLAGQTYVNVHTSAHPDGEIRGQIVVSALGGVAPSGGSSDGGATSTTSGSGY